MGLVTRVTHIERNDIGCSHDEDHEDGEQDGEPEGRPGHTTTMPTMSRRAIATRRQRSGRFGPAVDSDGRGWLVWWSSQWR